MLENIFPIMLFPSGGLASSVIVPVWVGVLVVAFFNLRFGWVLSGLVVPGYLVPMLIVNPVLAFVNFAEALITLMLAMLVSNRISIWANLSHFFGRDRFFLIVLISIFVRLTLDTWGFDIIGGWFADLTGEQIPLRNDLHSFGLIIIALMSNQMWKTGVLRGSLHIFVTVGITLVIVRYGLMTVTNFSLTNLAFMYEEVSVAILASPKSYMILLVSCYVASRMNLRYGWEYAGILVPSLLAIQWYQPLKIMATFAETFVVLGLASLLLRNRVIANMDISGARKLILFFTVAFIYKFALTLSLGVIAPYQKASDFFAFGYLLSTLIAIKMHDKNLVIGMSRTVLQSSLVALLIATVIGFSLFKAVPFVNQFWFSNEAMANQSMSQPINSGGDLTAWLIENKSRAYALQDQSDISTQSLKSISHFRDAIKQLVSYRNSRDLSDLVAANELLSSYGAVLQRVEDKYLVISHRTDATFGNYVINLDPDAQELLIQAPNALSERQSYDTAFAIFKLANAAYLAISNGLVVSGATDLTNSNSVFSHFQMMTAKNEVVQVRTTTRNIIERARRWSAGQTLESGEIFAWVKRAIPAGLNLNHILQTTSSLSLNWFTPSFTNRQRDLSSGAFIELLLDRAAATKVQALARLSEQQPISEEDRLSIDGYLHSWLTSNKILIAEKSAATYEVPELGEMLFMLDEVIDEVLAIIESERISGAWTEFGVSRLSQINRLLAYFNYQLIQYQDINTQETFLVVSELFGQFPPKHWGTYVFRLESDSSLVVEVPRPLFERRTFELGLHAFQTLKAKALFIAGAHPQTNADGSSDILKLRNRRSLFTTMHYGIARYYSEYPLHFVQIRSLPLRQQQENPEIDVVIDGTARSRINNELLFNYFTEQNLKVRSSLTDNVSDGAVALSELGLNSQTAQLRYQRNKTFSVAWVAQEVRQRFRQGESLLRLQNQLAVSAIEVATVNVAEYIDVSELNDQYIEGATHEQLLAYADGHNIVALHNALMDKRLSLKGLMDIVTNQLVLEVQLDKRVVGFLNLNPVSMDHKKVVRIENEVGRHFIEGRYVWLGH